MQTRFTGRPLNSQDVYHVASHDESNVGKKGGKNHGAPNQTWGKRGGKLVGEGEGVGGLEKIFQQQKNAYKVFFPFPPVLSPTYFPHIFPHVETRRRRPIIIIIYFLYFFRKKRRKNFCKAAVAEGVNGGNIWGKPLHLLCFTSGEYLLEGCKVYIGYIDIVLY